MKNLNGMSKQLTEALDVETAYRAYVKLQMEYNEKYGVHVSYPDTEVKRLEIDINSEEDAPDWMSNKKRVKKTLISASSDLDLLL